MWNFDAKKMIDEFKKELENQKKEIENLKTMLDMMDKKLSAVALSPSLPIELKSKIEDLEIWRGKMHNLLIEKTPTNKEKISKNYAFLKGRL